MKNIPVHWKGNPICKTRTALIQKREQQKRPHISFDLDGDGVVGGQDYLISKRCDLDLDGILNSTQRQLAQKLREKNRFFWGCESSGVNRSYRIVQKRGKAVFSEDFSILRETYPVQEYSPQQIRTFGDIQRLRQQEIQNIGKKYQEKLQTEFQMILAPEKLINLSHFSPSPKYRSISQKKSLAYKQNRIFQGLSETPMEISRKGKISLDYKASPKFSCKSAMMAARKKQVIENQTQTVNFNHQLEQQRLKQRQEKYIYNDAQGLTYKEIQKKKLAADFQHYTETFTSRPLGIHGTELPTFKKYKPEYWNKQTHLEQSLRKLLQTRKATQALHRGKPELLVINDGQATPLPHNKQYVAFNPKEKPVSLKPNQNAFVLSQKEKYVPKKTEFSKDLTQYLQLKKSALVPQINEVHESVPSTTKGVYFPKRRFSRTPIAVKLAGKNLSLSPVKGSPVRTCAFNY